MLLEIPNYEFKQRQASFLKEMEKKKKYQCKGVGNAQYLTPINPRDSRCKSRKTPILQNRPKERRNG